MSITTLPKPPPSRPPAGAPRWRMAAAVITAVVVAVAAVVVALLLRSDSGQPGAAPSASPTGQPSTAPSAQPPAAGFGYQPLWPFTGVADAGAWQQAYRAGGHQPWHLDARLTALSFASGFLGYTNIDRVAGQTSSGSQTWVTVGYADTNNQTAAAAVVHLARIGVGADAPWEVVGTRDTTLTLTRPAYGTTVVSPVTVGGRITGVDESLRVQVRAIGTPVLGQVTGIPAGGEGSPWSAQVGFTAAAGTVLTIAVSTGGHNAPVERFAVTGARAGAGSPAVGTWRLLPPAPVAGLSVSVWTGTEMLLFGQASTGSSMTVVGAGYNPATRTWHRLRAAPPVQIVEGAIGAVWTGSEALVYGAGFGAAYNPATNTWRDLPGQAGSGYSVLVWTGRLVIGWGGGCCGGVSASGAEYNPATNIWRAVPAAPLSGRHTVGAWTGTELILAGGNDARGGIFRDAAAYNPATRTWRRLPPLPAPRDAATATWDGSEVLLAGGWGPPGPAADHFTLYPSGVAYNPTTNRWRTLPAGDPGRVDHVAVWTGRTLLVWGGRTLRAGTWTTPRHGIAFDPATSRWSALPTAPLRGRIEATAVWTGNQMIVWGGSMVTGAGTSLADGAAYTP
jgi:Galactose oxidase, central domain